MTYCVLALNHCLPPGKIGPITLDLEDGLFLLGLVWGVFLILALRRIIRLGEEQERKEKLGAFYDTLKR